MREIELDYEEAVKYFIEKELSNDTSLMNEDVEEKIEKSVDLLNGYSVMGYKIAEIIPQFQDSTVILQNTEFKFVGKDIYKHLFGCDKLYIFVATLGYGVDRIIKSFQICDLSLSYYLDTLAGMLIEKFCDFINEKIAKKEEGKDVTQRFSCGYGDFPLETQNDILKLLDAEKALGIRLTEGGMMTPFKTVTAVIGAGKAGNLDRCAICKKHNFCKKDKCSD